MQFAVRDYTTEDEYNLKLETLQHGLQSILQLCEVFVG